MLEVQSGAITRLRRIMICRSLLGRLGVFLLKNDFSPKRRATLGDKRNMRVNKRKIQQQNEEYSIDIFRFREYNFRIER